MPYSSANPPLSDIKVALRLNWFPVQVPNSPLRLDARYLDTELDGPVPTDQRSYAVTVGEKEKWLHLSLQPSNPPLFGEEEVDVNHIPRLTSTLIQVAVQNHFRARDFEVYSGLGESRVLRRTDLPSLPDSITFQEGLTIKPFNISEEDTYRFGVVLNYSSGQKFVQTLADDSRQVTLALAGLEVSEQLDDGEYHSWNLRRIDEDKAIVGKNDLEHTTRLSKLRLKASYQAISSYFDLNDPATARSVIRTLQTASLSLNKNGFSNINRLADQYSRIIKLLDPTSAGNINIFLPTLSSSVISLSTQPMDVELMS